MIKVTVTNNTSGALAHVRAVGWDVIKRLVVYFWTACQTSLNVSNPAPHKTPAKKGEPPRKRTGFGAANVIYELDQQAMAGRVGVLSNARYMAFLEAKGWSWLKYTLDKTLPQLQAIAGQPSKGGTP